MDLSHCITPKKDKKERIVLGQLDTNIIDNGN
jgi:hypothetical protein